MGKSLPMTILADRGQKFTCRGCTRCCHDLVVHLTTADVERIDRNVGATVTDANGETPSYLRLGRAWVLAKRPDGACVFLTDQGKCRLHADFGPTAKPLACRMFPFTVRLVDKEWQAAIRFDCPTVARSDGQSLSAYRDELGGLSKSLSSVVTSESDAVELSRGVTGTASEVRGVIEAMDRCMRSGRSDVGFERRLRTVAFVCDMLARAKLEKVRETRLGELVEMLFSGASDELDASPLEPASARARRLFRQLVFAYGTSMSLDDLRRGRIARFAMILRQLRDARRFKRGRGLLPWSDTGEPTFAQVETIRSAVGEDAGAISELLTRYLRGRLASRAICGAGYYGWPLFEGLAALWLGVVAIGWFARVSACRAGRDRINLDDVVDGVGMVDRGIGRLPALGTGTERLRTRYLTHDGAFQGLLTSYPIP